VEYNKGPHLYLYNITLKLNLKLGGTTTVLDSVISKSIPQLGDKHMIIFGADVTHPTHGQPSSLAVVCMNLILIEYLNTFKLLNYPL
jgi:hypothetical protein